MASYTVTRSKHATLSTTVADTITIGSASSGQRFGTLHVINRDATNPLYFTFNRSATAPTVAVGAADDTFVVAVNSALSMPIGHSATNIVTVSVVGNGNAYSVACSAAG